VVVAYNDSGSHWQSGFATNLQNLSFNGFSTSDDQGEEYVDRGFLSGEVGVCRYDRRNDRLNFLGDRSVATLQMAARR